MQRIPGILVALAVLFAAGLLVNAVIGSVILNELIAPPLVKYALVKAGETALEGADS